MENDDLIQEPEDEHSDEETNECINKEIHIFNKILYNEMNSPDLLPYNGEMIHYLEDQIKNQQSYVNMVSDKEFKKTDEQQFTCHLYQMELDRIKFMISSYLRVRLAKIQNYPIHTLKEKEVRARLSDQEFQFAARYADLLEKHYNDLVLGKIPEEFAAIDDDEMITKPYLDKFVFCETLHDIGNIQSDTRGTEETILHKKGRHVIRYAVIKSLLEQDKVKLI